MTFQPEQSLCETIGEITGHTRILGILADPIAHVKAPPLINRIARLRGKDTIMVPFHVTPTSLERVLGGLRAVQSFDGAIVTVPHKSAVASLCDEISDQARAVGAVNVIRLDTESRLIGDILDGTGFLSGLAAAGVQVSGKKAYLVGAGGAANAIAFALAAAGIEHLTLANRTRSKAEALRERLNTFYPNVNVVVGDENPSGHDIIINGTLLGMRPEDPLPLDAQQLEASMVVAEVVMEPEITPLLQMAQTAGCHIHRGKPMLDCQLELMADFFGL
jgi:shikimate dehydrogenase